MSDAFNQVTDWREEANVVIQDIKQHVNDISVSKLPCSKTRIYFNLTTFEGDQFCIKLASDGFRIVGEKYDTVDKEDKYSVFETPYSLLDSVSSSYRESFGRQLLKKLNKLHESQKKEENKRKEESREEIEGKKYGNSIDKAEAKSDQEWEEELKKGESVEQQDVNFDREKTKVEDSELKEKERKGTRASKASRILTEAKGSKEGKEKKKSKERKPLKVDN